MVLSTKMLLLSCFNGLKNNRAQGLGKRYPSHPFTAPPALEFCACCAMKPCPSLDLLIRSICPVFLMLQPPPLICPTAFSKGQFLHCLSFLHLLASASGVRWFLLGTQVSVLQRSKYSILRRRGMTCSHGLQTKSKIKSQVKAWEVSSF